jgi:hypothetical protein
MTNAIFDLSNMFFRSMFIVGGYGKKQYTFDSEKETDQLMRKVATDVSSVIRQINPSRVIFALDSRSWRKDIPIDENEGYKGNRKKSEHINWDNIYKVMKDFADIMVDKGFIVSQIDNSEADDLIALWAEELVHRQGQHAILISADEDVRQLVGSNGKAFSVVYNPFTMGKNATKKLFVPSGFQDWMNEMDIGSIFDRSIDVDKEDFERIIQDKTKVEYTDGNEIALRKIFCGDDGDNVPSIYSWIAKNKEGDVLLDKNGEPKVARITPSKFEKIVDYIGAKDYKDLEEKADVIYDQIVEISGEHPPFKMEDRIKRQNKLVVLNSDLFPPQIVKEFNKDAPAELGKSQVHPQTWNMLTMLEGTRYVSPDGKSSRDESSIFKEVDRITNKELF